LLTNKRSETHSAGKNRIKKTYDADERYIGLSSTLLSRRQDANAATDLYLEPGEFSYPFNITLPTDLPTSFEHSIGRIRYSIIGTIEIPWYVNFNITKIIELVRRFLKD
jgi:hypothetical protein